MQPLTSSLQTTRIWLRDVAVALGSNDPRDAWHALRAVLATLRDQLPTAEVADLASELPITVRGAYYDGWSGQMQRAESHHTFINAVRGRLGPNPVIDPEKAVQAVLHVVRSHVSAGELRHVEGVLPMELKGMVAPA
ncbi:MAG: DUF2267 domain-containing protein [Pseudomonadota bacterium]|nr:DUF2267 domain-containing protein [Pseudomonadota bacterium]